MGKSTTDAARTGDSEGVGGLGAEGTPIEARVVATQRDGTPEMLLVGGVLFDRAIQQEGAASTLQEYTLHRRIEALAGPRAQEAAELLSELESLRNGRDADERDHLWKRIGWFLTEAGAPQLWRALYHRYVVDDAGVYTVGDEWRFLWSADDDPEHWRRIINDPPPTLHAHLQRRPPAPAGPATPGETPG